MASGCDAQQLGIHGFRNYSVGNLEPSLADATWTREQPIWNYLDRLGLSCVVLNVPLTYPPQTLRNGVIVCGFLAPNDGRIYGSPPQRIAQLQDLGPYPVDISNEDRTDPEQLLSSAKQMLAKHLEVAGAALADGEWDFAMWMELGPDRIHHTLWPWIDPNDPRYDPTHSIYQGVLDYYRELDRAVGTLLGLCDEDTVVCVASDHGAQSMLGGFRVNQWLLQAGWLSLRDPQSEARRFDPSDIDWARTKAFAWGGYHARIFLNVEGREPHGIIPPPSFADERARLANLLGDVRGPNHERWANQVLLAPSAQVLEQPRGKVIPPDITVYFDQLAWRAIDSVGGDTDDLWWPQSDHGQSGANHDLHGIWIIRDFRRDGPGVLQPDVPIWDLAPTWCSLLDIRPMPNIRGRTLVLD